MLFPSLRVTGDDTSLIFTAVLTDAENLDSYILQPIVHVTIM
jgi:hypothetical protein